MDLLITMAGRGSRFRDAGVAKPKHEILVRGKPMFDWAMQSLEAFFDERFVFVTQEEHDPTPFLKDACARLGIERYEEVTLSSYSDGQAATAMAADGLIDGESGVAIYNIDTYIEPGEVTPEDIRGDGFIPTFTAPGERWSFVTMNEDGLVTNVSEKEKISDHATAGFYYFDRWNDFVEAYEQYGKTVESDYGETYVAPHYNYLLKKEREIFARDIDPESVHVLGTPDDLRQFDPEFESGGT